jgi:hypothetical protein
VSGWLLKTRFLLANQLQGGLLIGKKSALYLHTSILRLPAKVKGIGAREDTGAFDVLLSM